MAAPHLSTIELKREARARGIAMRVGCDPAWGARLTEHVLAECPPGSGTVVAGFWPMPDEIDIRPLLRRLHEMGHRIVLPETPPRGQPLVFRLWEPDRSLLAGRFGTFHPDGPALAPDYVLVPLLAFDRRGHRLGYGGGYYDRTLPLLAPGEKIGCAFAAQELDAVPVEPYDVRLDAIATERGVIHIESC